ncbi:putative colanic acid biosynthesis acetyltransferase [Xanthobacter flavus]|uniref:putative colanic acid biosynthesis acetyltransferase n=1 Tax=Xanthobacter flavus TaxID=281 RepID=UPI003727D822
MNELADVNALAKDGAQTNEPIFQDLSRFRVEPGFRGRSGMVVLLWQIVQDTLFAWSPQPAYGWRRFLLRLFGAQVGEGVIIRSTARVTYPWKVKLGNHCWVGDHAELYSLGPIAIGNNAVVSQKSYLCAGSHDPSDMTFPLTNPPVVVEDEAWVATDCFISPGVTIGRGAIVAARSTVRTDIPPGTVAAGSPATVRKMRARPTRRLPGGAPS